MNGPSALERMQEAGFGLCVQHGSPWGVSREFTAFECGGGCMMSYTHPFVSLFCSQRK